MESEHAGNPGDTVETGAPCLEVRILWGTSALQVVHLTPPRSFHVGESSEGGCDFVLPAAPLGALRVPLVRVDGRGSVTIVVPPRAACMLQLAGQPPAFLRADEALARARPYCAIRGACELPLPPGASATVEVGGVVFEVAHGRASRSRRRRDRSVLFHVAASLAAHALVLAGAASAIPPLGELPTAPAETDQQYLLGPFSGTTTEREEDEPIVEAVTRIAPDGEERAYSRCGERRGGSMGDPGAQETGLRYGVQGPADNADPHIARVARDRDTWPTAIGFTEGDPWGGDRDAPTMVWGRDDSLGNDEASARGNAWGDGLGAAFGSPGAGVGVKRPCETCGARGRGRDAGRTAPGGATGTENAGVLVGGRPPR